MDYSIRKKMMNYIEVFIRSYYELTDKGWQVVALYKRIFIGKQNSLKSSTISISITEATDMTPQKYFL